MRRSNLGSVPMERQIPMAGQASLFRPHSAKAEQAGQTPGPIDCGSTFVDSGTLYLNGAAVCVGLTTIGAGTIMLGSDATLDGGAIQIDRGLLELGPALSLDGDLAMAGSVAGAIWADAPPEEPSFTLNPDGSVELESDDCRSAKGRRGLAKRRRRDCVQRSEPEALERTK